MSNLAMTQTEEKSIDSKVEQMMDWAQSRQIEAEQLALDSARLMACTTDRLDRLSKQGFYKRCWSRFNGDANAMERANVNDVIQMQKMAFRYVNMLQEQQLLMAHSLLSLKNNLNSLAVREEETRNLIALLAQRTLERFEQLEGRVGKLETSSNLHDWLFTLEERDYEEKIPTDYMRLLRIINDFYEIKNDNWNNNDLMFMRKAIRTVGLNPKEKVSINTLINKLADEIQSNQVGFDTYDKAITLFAPDGISNYSQFAIDNVSSPVFATLHGLNTHYRDKMDAVEALQDSLSISTSEALKTLLRNGIKSMNVNLDYEFPLAETAIEILGCIRLAEKLSPSLETKNIEGYNKDALNLLHTDEKLGHFSFDYEMLKHNINLLENSLIYKEGTIIGAPQQYVSDILNNLDYRLNKEHIELICISDGSATIFFARTGGNIVQMGRYNNKTQKVDMLDTGKIDKLCEIYERGYHSNINEELDAIVKRISEAEAPSLSETAKPSAEVVYGPHAIEFYKDVIVKLSEISKLNGFKKEQVYMIVPDPEEMEMLIGRRVDHLGQVPSDYDEIVSHFDNPISKDNIGLSMSDGHIGLMGQSDMRAIIVFDRINNRFGYLSNVFMEAYIEEHPEYMDFLQEYLEPAMQSLLKTFLTKEQCEKLFG